MFAGPNGSGKSTLKAHLRPDQLGCFVNADEIEAELRQNGSFNVSSFRLGHWETEFHEVCRKSTLIERVGSDVFWTERDLVQMDIEKLSSYHAALIAEFLRTALLSRQVSFSFETVMAHPSKVQILRDAKNLGYRTYLYFVATEAPEINLARIAYRVSEGGHQVSSDKVRSRFERSLGLLGEAIKNADRSYIFDNSQEGAAQTLLAEITGGQYGSIHVIGPDVPAWFKKYVLDQAQDAF